MIIIFEPLCLGAFVAILSGFSGLDLKNYFFALSAKKLIMYSLACKYDGVTIARLQAFDGIEQNPGIAYSRISELVVALNP